MRIGFVVYGGLEHTSGGYLYDRRLVEYHREAGDEVATISLPRRSYRRHLLDNISPAVYRRLDGDYDVLVQDELCHPSLLLANRLQSPVSVPSGDVPVVSLVHSARTAEARAAGSRWRPLYREVERRYLRSVDGVIATSRATAATVEWLLGDADRPRIVARPGRGHRSPGLSREAIAARAGEGPLRVLFVGNLLPRKGLHVLVTGLARLPAGDWRLTVVGGPADCGYAAAIRRLVDRSGRADAVTMTGRLDDDELAAEFRRHHVLAVPSTYEAFGIVYLEGMGFGLPALATTAGGADEIVSDGENGFLVAPNDPAAVAAALGSVLADRDRLRRLSLAARETYKDHHGWDETGARIREFLRAVVTDATP